MLDRLGAFLVIIFCVCGLVRAEEEEESVDAPETEVVADAPAEEPAVTEEESQSQISSDVTSEVESAVPESTQEPAPATVVPEKAVQPVVVEPQQPELEEQINLDTMALQSGGNWLQKRIWYERAQAVCDKIRELFKKVVASQKYYLTQREEIVKKIDTNFITLGFEQGKLEELLYELAHRSAEQATISKVAQAKTLLEGLKKDLDTIGKYNESLDAVLSQVLEEITKAGSYQDEAHDKLDEIKKVDDIRARAIAYEIDALYKDIEHILLYLTGDLTRYYDGLLQKLNEGVGAVATAGARLKQDGIDVKKELEILKKNDESAQDNNNQEEPIEENGWISSLWNRLTEWISTAWGWIASLWH